MTFEEEAAYYGSVASGFNYVFSAAYQPAARVVWSTAQSTPYSAQCKVDDTSKPAMKFRGCTVSEARFELFNNILEDYQRYVSFTDPDMGYNTDLLRGLIEKLEQIDFTALGCIPDDEADDTPQGGGGDSPSESTSSSSSSSSAAAKGSQLATPKTSASKASATPKTADPLTGFGGLLSVAAVAGTAMAAYSARRVANERRKSEED